MGVRVGEHIERRGTSACERIIGPTGRGLVEQCLFWCYPIRNLEAGEFADVEHVMELNLWKYTYQHFGDEVAGGS